jgi:hypothetical protein
MNPEHDRQCGSPEWAAYLQSEILPSVAAAGLGDDMLEIGPGPCAATEWLRHRVTHLTGLEADEAAAARLAQRYAGGNVRLRSVSLMGPVSASRAVRRQLQTCLPGWRRTPLRVSEQELAHCPQPSVARRRGTLRRQLAGDSWRSAASPRARCSVPASSPCAQRRSVFPRTHEACLVGFPPIGSTRPLRFTTGELSSPRGRLRGDPELHEFPAAFTSPSMSGPQLSHSTTPPAHPPRAHTRRARA